MENSISFSEIIVAPVRLVSVSNFFLQGVKLRAICCLLIVSVLLATWKRRSGSLIFSLLIILIIVLSWGIFHVSDVLVSISSLFFFFGFWCFLICLFIFNFDLGFVRICGFIGYFFLNHRNSSISLNCLVCSLSFKGRSFLRLRKWFNNDSLGLSLIMLRFGFCFILLLFLFGLFLGRSWLLLLLRFRLFSLSIFDSIMFLFLLKEAKSNDIKDVP